MKIPRYIVIKLEMIGKDTVKATEITDRCEIYEYEADEDEPQSVCPVSIVFSCDECHREKCDYKTEPSNSEIPNNCANCKHLKKHNGNLADWVCDRKGSIVTNPYDKECDEMWERKDEPQTDTEIAKAIVHKMIDDSVIAADAYPDLRQKMHDAVDEYEPQTDCDGCQHYADKHTADACYECKRSYTDGYVPQAERSSK